MSKTTTALTAGQQAVIDSIESGEILTAAQVADRLGKKAPAVTSTLKSLVRKGLLVHLTNGGYTPVNDLADEGTQTEATPLGTTHLTLVEDQTAETLEAIESGEEAPRPSPIRVPEFLADVAEECAARQAKGTAAVVVESKAGDYIRSAKVGAAWITTDGMFACVKGTPDSTDVEPWALYLMTADVADRLVGTFKTSSTPFLVETQAAYRA